MVGFDELFNKNEIDEEINLLKERFHSLLDKDKNIDREEIEIVDSIDNPIPKVHTNKEEFKLLSQHLDENKKETKFFLQKMIEMHKRIEDLENTNSKLLSLVEEKTNKINPFVDKKEFKLPHFDEASLEKQIFNKIQEKSNKIMDDLFGTKEFVEKKLLNKKKSIHEDIDYKYSFQMKSGENLFSLKDLLFALKNTSENVFKHHVSSKHNDFATWIKDILKLDKLAEEIGKLKTKQEIVKQIKEYISKHE